MISSSNLVRPKVTSSNGRAMGRYEHKNRYQVLGADAEDEDDESEDSLAEPLVDTDVEVSDAEGGEPDDPGQGPAAAADGGEAQGVVQQGDAASRPRAKLIKRPVSMTRAERDQHVAEGHVNYHPGCEFCTRARGRPEQHKRANREGVQEETVATEEEEMPLDVPTVSFDFCFLSQLQQEKSNTVLVAKDAKRKTLMATMCPNKSTVDAMHSTGVCKRLAAFLDFLGYPRIALRSDQEKSTLAMQERVKAMRRMETVLTNSKKKVSQTNGVIERAVQEIEGIVRTIKMHLEHLIERRIPANHAILAWMTEYAAEMYNRHREVLNKRTPYELLKGRQRAKPMALFGETVLWLPLNRKPDGHVRQLEPKFKLGVWLGVDPRNDEILIATENGIERAQCVKRRPDGGAFEAERVLAIRATPLDPGLGQDVIDKGGIFAESVPLDDQLEEVIKQDRSEEDRAVRRLRIRPEDVQDAGYTEGCAGCRAIREGGPSQNHNSRCRARIEAHLSQKSEGRERIRKAEERLNEAVVRASERLETAAATSGKLQASSSASSSKDKAAVEVRHGQSGPPQNVQPTAKRRQQDESAYKEAVEKAAKEEADAAGGMAQDQEPSSESAGDSAPRTDETAGGAEVQEEHASGSGAPSRNSSTDVSVNHKRRADDSGDNPRADKFQAVDAVQMSSGRRVRKTDNRKASWNEDVVKFDKQVKQEELLENMRVVREALGCRADLSEVYSPPRIVDQAKKMHMNGGFSLDFTVPDKSGYIWDFDQAECRDKAMRLVKETKPYMLIGSPECTPFSSLQNLNMRTPEGCAKVLEARSRGEVHLQFCRDMYVEQMRCGRHFLHEHPLTATSWTVDAIKTLAESPLVHSVVAHQCAFGLKSRDKRGEGFAKKPTRFLTSSIELAKTLDRQCPGGHRHVHLVEGRARAAAIYPPGLCKAVCKGTLRQARMDASDMFCIECKDTGVGEICNVEHEEPNWQRYYDDLTGKELVREMVEAARREELKVVREMKVWSHAPRELCLQETGKPPIKLRWVDINKGDEEQPVYRSRIVAKEIRTHARPDLFTATPPLEYAKYLISCAASRQSEERPCCILLQDIGKAYFHAPATRRVFIELPPEDSSPGMCGLLEKSLYGTRDAALNWAEAYTQALTDLGFAKGEANPCSFVNAKRGMETVVHGDDFLSIGSEEDLLWFDSEMAKRFKVKTLLMGAKEHHVKQARFLNRIVSWEPEGIIYEPDPRHAEILIRDMGLEKANGLKVPMVKEETRRSRKDLEKDAEDIVEAVDINNVEFAGACSKNGQKHAWSREFRECAQKIKEFKDSKVRCAYRADYNDAMFLKARRELYLARSLAQEEEELARRSKRMFARATASFIGEVANREELMKVDGWTKMGEDDWYIMLEDAVHLPSIPAGRLVRRRVADANTGETIHDIVVGPATKKSQVVKKLRQARDIIVYVTLAAEEVAKKGWEDEPMVPADATRYRAATARLNFLALDRPDLQYSSKECSRVMSAPMNRHWELLKRIARYLIHAPRLVHVYRWQDMPKHLTAFSDSDWAGCRETRKSTSGGCFMHGGHLLKAYSKTQQNIALSSGEAEFYSMGKAASEAMGLKAMAQDFGKVLQPWLYVDANAALGVAQRVGLGKVRHLDTQRLWLQQAVRQKRLGIAKVIGTMNPADAMTKAVDSVTLERLLGLMSLERRSGRAEIAPNTEKLDETEEVYAIEAFDDFVEDEVAEKLIEFQHATADHNRKHKAGRGESGGKEIEPNTLRTREADDQGEGRVSECCASYGSLAGEVKAAFSSRSCTQNFDFGSDPNVESEECQTSDLFFCDAVTVSTGDGCRGSQKKVRPTSYQLRWCARASIWLFGTGEVRTVRLLFQVGCRVRHRETGLDRERIDATIEHVVGRTHPRPRGSRKQLCISATHGSGAVRHRSTAPGLLARSPLSHPSAVSQWLRCRSSRSRSSTSTRHWPHRTLGSTRW